MTWRIFITSAADKQLHRLPLDRQAQISEAINKMEEDPFGGDVDKLKDQEGAWRLRVGSYRIIFKVLKERTIFVYEIKRRTSTTY